MLELGDAAPHCHADLGSCAAQVADIVLVYGQWSPEVAKGAQSAGMDKGQVVRMHDHDEICAWLNTHIQPEDCLLIKGSRGMRMEKVVSFLLHKFNQVA
jgi:UDP-N-acetylmuramoyl-tripeptide--D-alanyl-D-alanine ligase